MDKIYQEENGKYEIDCRNAVWSTDQIHEDYQHHVGASVLKDVDFVIENETHILLVEYKNANVKDAKSPESFDPNKDNSLNKVSLKFYDTLHWLYLAGKDKPKKYIYVVEYPKGNSTSRRMLRNKLQKRLPFELQSEIDVHERKLIDDVKVVDIAEWNRDSKLGLYPIRPVSGTDT